MKSTKETINKIVARVILAINDTDISKLHVARELLWAHNVVNWRLTEYGGWVSFVDEVLPMSSSSVYRYISVAELVEKYGYTQAECETMLKTCGWSNFVYGLLDMTRKIATKTFESRYGKNHKDDTARARYYDADKGDRSYSFSLPEEQADAFDMHLVNYGMMIGEHGRRGVRDAMIKLVKHKLK